MRWRLRSKLWSFEGLSSHYNWRGKRAAHDVHFFFDDELKKWQTTRTTLIRHIGKKNSKVSRHLSSRSCTSRRFCRHSQIEELVCQPELTSTWGLSTLGAAVMRTFADSDSIKKDTMSPSFPSLRISMNFYFTFISYFIHRSNSSRVKRWLHSSARGLITARSNGKSFFCTSFRESFSLRV